MIDRRQMALLQLRAMQESRKILEQFYTSFYGTGTQGALNDLSSETGRYLVENSPNSPGESELAVQPDQLEPGY